MSRPPPLSSSPLPLGRGVMHRMSAFPTLSVTVTRAVVSGDGGFGRGSGHDREPQ